MKCYCCGTTALPTKLYQRHYVCNNCIEQTEKAIKQIEEAEKMEAIKIKSKENTSNVY